MPINFQNIPIGRLPDFIGYERVASQNLNMSFKDSRSFVHKLGLKKYQDFLLCG